MPKIPFPHILTYPKDNSFPPRGPIVRIVSPEDMLGYEFNITVMKGKDVRYARHKVTEVLSKRKARGDWSEWEKHPDYYECKTEEMPL